MKDAKKAALEARIHELELEVQSLQRTNRNLDGRVRDQNRANLDLATSNQTRGAQINALAAHNRLLVLTLSQNKIPNPINQEMPS